MDVFNSNFTKLITQIINQKINFWDSLTEDGLTLEKMLRNILTLSKSIETLK